MFPFGKQDIRIRTGDIETIELKRKDNPPLQYKPFIQRRKRRRNMSMDVRHICSRV
jgi:hypothetical protein